MYSSKKALDYKYPKHKTRKRHAILWDRNILKNHLHSSIEKHTDKISIEVSAIQNFSREIRHESIGMRSVQVSKIKNINEVP